MPKILSSTPPWLSRPSSGFDLFSSEPSNLSSLTNNGNLNAPTTPAAASIKNEHHPEHHSRTGPRRTIARRGTEIFVAVGTRIRWADLSYLKNEWEDKAERRRHQRHQKHNGQMRNGNDQDSDELEGASFRTLKVAVSEPIQQLIPSPLGNLLAILTSHTAHIAILPDPSHLSGPDAGPIRLKTHTLGPTTHVLAQSPVVSALWHPLGVAGTCLVTVTAEAVVRVWELSEENRWSFDSPTLAMDLKKLADGRSSEDDFAASRMGINKGFSPDSVDMEVAAASFGGTASGRENGWAPLTLWLAMREGDVYALCPFLPSKWQPPASLIPSLSVSIISRFASAKADPTASAQEVQACQQQYAWISEIDNQEPAYISSGCAFDPEVEVYTRPKVQGAVPRLQGPFMLDAMPDEEDDEPATLCTDVHVIAGKVDADELTFGEEDDFDYEGLDDGGLSVAIICLVTSSGRLHVCLDLDGVEGAWLPTKRSKVDLLQETAETPSLLIFETLDTLRPRERLLPEWSWPVFTSDPYSPYSLFVTHSQSATYVSFSTWVDRLESELQSSGDVGFQFRLETFTQGVSTLRERVMDHGRDLSTSESDERQELSACVVFRDSDLGYLLLTEAQGQPFAVEFDLPDLGGMPNSDGFAGQSYEHEFRQLVSTKPRDSYQPPSSLWAPPPLSGFVESRAQGRYKRSLTEEIKLSQATLILMTDAHKVLSQHTHHLGIAAAELFRRCERMQQEFKEQIKRAAEVAERIEAVIGEDGEDVDETTQQRGRVGIDRRVEAAKSRQEALVGRYDALRRRLARRAGRDLSDKEVAWAAEVDTIESAIVAEKSGAGEDEESRSLAWARYELVRELTADLVSQAKEFGDDAEADHGGFQVPADIRKAKVTQVMKLLDRESALVDATRSRLERLSTSSSQD